MSKIAVIIDDYFEDSEYTEPVSVFREKGHDIVHVGIEKGKTVKGKKQQTPVVIDEADTVSCRSVSATSRCWPLTKN